MSPPHGRSVLQTVILIVLIAASRYTTLLESRIGQASAVIVIIVVGADVVLTTWRRFGQRTN